MNSIVKSYWGIELKSNVIGRGSDTLAVILPGIGKPLNMVTLEYSSELALELGYDVLRIEYGFQNKLLEFEPETQITIVTEESYKLLASALRKGYKNLVLIGKDMGTWVQSAFNLELREYNITNIYLSPIDNAVELGIAENSLVITGSNDPYLSDESLEKIQETEGVEIINIERANEGLNVKGDTERSLEIQLAVIKLLKKYLRGKNL